MKKRINVLMVGVSKATRGGMWTVANSYLNNDYYNKNVKVKYIATATVGSVGIRLVYSFIKLVLATVYLILFRPDILHVHMSERSSVWRKGWLVNIAHWLHIVTIVHMHGANFQDWYGSLSGAKKVRVIRIFKNTSKVIILGSYWRHFIESLGVESSKIVVVYNSVKTHNYVYNTNSKQILFLGAVIKRKGVYDILEAIRRIKKSIPDGWKFVFYGPLFDEDFPSKIKQLKLNAYVEYKGYLDSKNFEKVFSNIAFNLLPSYNEGLPMTILETMSYGIPSITTGIAAIPELVTDELDGLVQHPGEIYTLQQNILRLIKDKRLRDHLSVESYKKITKEFTSDRHMEKIITEYKKSLINS